MLFFSHIPKTAGTSLSYLLQRHFGFRMLSANPRTPGTYTREDYIKDLKVFPFLKCMVGHSLKPFEDFQEKNSGIKWFSFLRDPEQRFMSHYIHQQTSKVGYHKMDLLSWSSTFSRSNIQTRWIAGEEDLLAAKQILKEKFTFIGITERYLESIILMKSRLGLNGLDLSIYRPQMVSRNTELKKSILENSLKFKELILEQNYLDIELYEYAKRNLFQDQIASYGMDLLEAESARLRSLPTVQSSDNIETLSFKLMNRFIYRFYSWVRL